METKLEYRNGQYVIYNKMGRPIHFYKTEAAAHRKQRSLYFGKKKG